MGNGLEGGEAAEGRDGKCIRRTEFAVVMSNDNNLRGFNGYINSKLLIYGRD